MSLIENVPPHESGSTLPLSAIILAAGASRRFGSAKLLTRLPARNGRAVIQITVNMALQAGLQQIIVVVGCYADEVRDLLAGQPVQIIENPSWKDGMSTTVHAGLDHVQPDSEAVLLMLADQPAVSPAIIRSLCERYLEERSPIVAPVYEGRRGNPVLFDRCTFDSLRRVTGDQGGRQVIASGEFQAELVEMDDRAVLLDIDQREDMETISTYMKERGETSSSC